MLTFLLELDAPTRPSAQRLSLVGDPPSDRNSFRPPPTRIEVTPAALGETLACSTKPSPLFFEAYSFPKCFRMRSSAIPRANSFRMRSCKGNNILD